MWDLPLKAIFLLLLTLQVSLSPGEGKRVQAKKRNGELYSYSDSEESGEDYDVEDSGELGRDGNVNDRGMSKSGNGNKASSGQRKVKKPYNFAPTPLPTWTQNPDYFERLRKKGYNDTDPGDIDYYAHYDFEFAKSGTKHNNFQTKYLKHQVKQIKRAQDLLFRTGVTGQHEKEKAPRKPERPEKPKKVEEKGGGLFKSIF